MKNQEMIKLDMLVKDALENQIKINKEIQFFKDNEENLTEEQKDKLHEIKYKIEKELLPKIEKLDKNNPKFYNN